MKKKQPNECHEYHSSLKKYRSNSYLRIMKPDQLTTESISTTHRTEKHSSVTQILPYMNVVYTSSRYTNRVAKVYFPVLCVFGEHAVRMFFSSLLIISCIDAHIRLWSLSICVLLWFRLFGYNVGYEVDHRSSPSVLRLWSMFGK